MITVNSIEWEPGCIVDGDVHGDYSEDRLADIAIGFGLELTQDNDPRVWRGCLRESEEQGDGMEENHREAMDEATTKLVELFNSVTDGGYFEWKDGSVFLVPDEDSTPFGEDQ